MSLIIPGIWIRNELKKVKIKINKDFENYTVFVSYDNIQFLCYYYFVLCFRLVKNVSKDFVFGNKKQHGLHFGHRDFFFFLIIRVFFYYG